MKKIFLVLIGAIIFFSCKKEEKETAVEELINVMPRHPWDYTTSLFRGTTENVNGFNGVQAGDVGQVQGARSIMDCVRLTGKSFDEEVYIVCMINTDSGYLWLQTGYAKFYNNTHPFNDFTSNIPNLTINIINGTAPFKFKQKDTFAIYHVEGTSRWRTNRHGIDILEFDTHALGGYITTVICGTAIFTTGSGNFPTVNFNPAIELFNNGSWSAATNGFNVYGASKVGTAGWFQDSVKYKRNEVDMGSSIPKVPLYSQIW